ncbi:DUF4183 domain-containing protein [Bacillus cereus]
MVFCFFDDLGSRSVTLPPLPENSYVNLYINGILQMDDIFTYTPAPGGVLQRGHIQISLPEGFFVKGLSPIVLEIIDFEVNSNSSTNT